MVVIGFRSRIGNRNTSAYLFASVAETANPIHYNLPEMKEQRSEFRRSKTGKSTNRPWPFDELLSHLNTVHLSNPFQTLIEK